MFCNMYTAPGATPKKILDLEYNKIIAMAKLLPDFRDTQEDSTSCTVIVAAAHAITNILTWSTRH